MNNKIGIVTLYAYSNYGNKFQNYAVKFICKRYEFDTDTIIIYDTLKPYLKLIISHLLKFKYIRCKRYLKFKKFSKNYLNERIFIILNKQIPDSIAKEYDYFIAGSDQVWNPEITQAKERYNYFLKFADRKQRICISPSFGVNEIPKEYEEEFRNGINGFDNLCCREQAGVDIIKHLTGREAELLIDPTLAISKKEWLDAFKNINPPRNDNYIIVAMLGELSYEMSNTIHNISEKYNLNIVNIFNDINNVYSPEEMIHLIAGAELIVTDSFHFSAFSINFNVPFIVYERIGNKVDSNMYSRISSLLNMFQLNERAYEKADIENILNCDFSNSNKILKQEREKFYKYIEAVLKSDD